MKDFDIDSTIEVADGDRKTRLLAQLHARTGIPEIQEHGVKSRKRFFGVKASAFGLVGICVVSLAIVLPISLRNETAPPSQERYTYTAAELSEKDLGMTIKEYAQKIGKDILYLDWYDVAEECNTTKYILPTEENNIIYVAEEITNGETGDNVQLCVVDINIDVDRFDYFKDNCLYEYEYNGVTINWSYDNIITSIAYFEYNDYKYYVQFAYPPSEQAILDIVKEMF
ncbi:MAG: hypothetical protein J1G01_01370 [Clostridiales bacterium]|nr:hypothetical protein [Clostridiales bacterium]